MPSALSLIRSRRGHFIPQIEGAPGLFVDTALESGLEYGVSYGLGQLYHRHGDKWYGRQAPRVAAIAGKIGGVLAQFATGGPNFGSGILNAIGSSGFAAMGLEKGLRDARDATNRRVVLLPKDAKLPAELKGQDVTTIGALPPKGRGLSFAQIEELAAAH